jgi:beta-galactosidase
MLGVIGNRFSIGKETYSPFAVELHYFRIEKRYWSICFERIKRAGYKIIATAVPWNVHQAEDKSLDFAGITDPKKDLVVFLELAREFGFKVILRPGPWVAGQMRNGGLPEYLFRDLKIFARDATGQEKELPADYGARGGYLPSYLHPNYQYHLKNFFKSFIETTKNYVHPRGPIFMVELDYETSYGRQLEPGSADYNPDVLEKYYGPFLEQRYEGDIKKLNQLYKEKNKDFGEVEPPREFVNLDQKGFPKALDWMRFREYMLRLYLENLEDVFKAYTVEPLIFRSLYFRPGDLLPAFNLVPEDRAPFLGSNVFPEGNYFDLAAKARFLKHEYGFAFACSFASGTAAENAAREEQIAPVHDNQRRFYLAGALANGFKGFNQYMFVDREHWYGAPLRNDGTVTSGYEIVKNFNIALEERVGLENMEDDVRVAVVGNRLYTWLRMMPSDKMLSYLPRLVDATTTGFCRDLMRLKVNFGVRENRDWESMSRYRVIFIPTCEVMAEADQQAIVELAKSGVTVILSGLMPKWDESFRDCQVLANHFRIKTTVDYRIGTVEHKGGQFLSYLYGSVRSTDDSRVRKIANVGAKTVGVCSSRYKGNLYLFSFDIASGGDHHKINLLESVLEGESIGSLLYCSDPAVDMSLQLSEKKGLLFLVAPPAGELSDGLEAGQKEIIVRVDLKTAGFKAPRVKLTNLFEGESAQPIKTTAKDLKGGIALSTKFPDGAIFLIERR